MQLPYSEKLNIAALSRLFDNKSECYKLFWFQAIVDHVCAGEEIIRYEDLIDEMIADAGYSIREMFVTQDVRNDRRQEKWINVIAGKTLSEIVK